MNWLFLALLILAQPPSLTVKTPEEWKARRTEILDGMLAAMGDFPAERLTSLLLASGKPVVTKTHTRTRIEFESEKGVWVPAWLMVPAGAKGKLPAVLCLHQTTKIGKDEPAGLGGKPELHYALHLVERGYITLAPDYPSFGEYPYDFKKSKFTSGSMKAMCDNSRAIDYLSAMANVNPNRIGVIGHSLGGHNAMFTAVFDTRIKACVSNCGFTSFPKYYGGKIKGWTSDRYMPRLETVYKLNAAKVPFDFPQVVAAIAPRAFLASSPLHDDNFEVGGVRDCIAAARPIYELLGAKEKLQANYPDCKHDFPPDVRKVAYEFLDRWLK